MRQLPKKNQFDSNLSSRHFIFSSCTKLAMLLKPLCSSPRHRTISNSPEDTWRQNSLESDKLKETARHAKQLEKDAKRETGAVEEDGNKCRKLKKELER